MAIVWYENRILSDWREFSMLSSKANAYVENKIKFFVPANRLYGINEVLWSKIDSKVLVGILFVINFSHPTQGQ